MKEGHHKKESKMTCMKRHRNFFPSLETPICYFQIPTNQRSSCPHFTWPPYTPRWWSVTTEEGFVPLAKQVMHQLALGWLDAAIHLVSFWWVAIGALKRKEKIQIQCVPFLNTSFYPLTSVEFKMASTCSGKPKYAPPHLLRCFPSVASDTVPMMVWLKRTLSCPFKEDRWVLPFSTPLSSRRLMLWQPWLCACRWCLKLLNVWDLLRNKPLVMVNIQQYHPIPNPTPPQGRPAN